MAKDEVKRLRGGWFVVPNGDLDGNLSGPWRTEEAAWLAAAYRWKAAHKAEREQA